MQTLAETILAIVGRRPGISEADLAFAIYGRREQQLVNGECRYLVQQRRLERRRGPTGVFGNFKTKAS
jgi:hypothetical protein